MLALWFEFVFLVKDRCRGPRGNLKTTRNWNFQFESNVFIFANFYRKRIVGCALESRRPRFFAYWKKYSSFLNPCTLLMQLRKDELCTDCTWESYRLFSLDVTIQNISFLNCIGITKILRKEPYFSNIHINEMKAVLTHSLRYFFDKNSGIYKGLNHLEKKNFWIFLKMLENQYKIWSHKK